MRIDELLGSLPNGAARIAGDIPDFASKVRHTRNYLTHYAEESRAKAAQGLELRRIAFALLDLLEIFLLLDLDITGKPVERIVARNTSRSYATAS